MFIFWLILLVIAVYVWYKIAIMLPNLIKTMFDDYPTISTALITGLLAFVSVPVGKYLENRYTIRNQIREERQKVYVVFLEWFISNILYGNINNNKNIVRELQEQQKLMTIYASDRVLKAYAVFKDITMSNIEKNLSEEEQTKYHILNKAPYVENLILAIRKDLGYRNKNINQYDILKLYINDLDKYVK